MLKTRSRSWILGLAIAQFVAWPCMAAAQVRLNYESPLGSYKAYVEQPVESWRESNDRVGRIGGWRAYAREARTGESVTEVPGRAQSAHPTGADPIDDDHPTAIVPAAGHHGVIER